MIRRPADVLAAALLPVVALGALGAACSGSSEPLAAEQPVLGHDALGPDPFASVDAAVPDPGAERVVAEATAAASDAEAELRAGDGEPTDAEVVAARLAAVSDTLTPRGIGYIRPRSAVGVPLLPGDASDICQLPAMIDQLTADPTAAAAFAAATGADPARIAEHLSTLRAGHLLDRATVRIYPLGGNEAGPAETVLAAGTAVLVDGGGLPRVRCRSASPLEPALTELDDRIVATSAFADRVVDAVISSDVPEELELPVDGVFTNDPSRALGPPDRVAVALGDDPSGSETTCGFSVTVEFTDNRLVDGPGDDLQILELGRSESTLVAVGPDPGDLREAGAVTHDSATLDLAAVTEPGEELAYVRLCDGPESSSEVPGSDVDAVAALNSTPAR